MGVKIYFNHIHYYQIIPEYELGKSEVANTPHSYYSAYEMLLYCISHCNLYHLHVIIMLAVNNFMIYCFIATAQQSSSTVIAHPGQNVELLCNVTPSGSQTVAWIINHVVYTVQQLHNGILTGYSTNGNNLIVENIMMNDDRNDTRYSCGTVLSTVSNPIVADIVDESDRTILYVAGEYQYTL